jgi:hypothetical protein
MLKTYIVLYREEGLDPLEHPFAFECDAEDADHAEEQCLNAWPDCDVVWVSETYDVEDALFEYWNA